MFQAIFYFLIILGLLVFVHELGHFATAKAFGVKVLEFGFGYPPRLFSIRKGETLYSINLLPLGGFVKLQGEEDPTDPRSLARKGTGPRFIILVAGSFMNVVLPIIIFSVLFMVPHQVIVNDVRILEVAPGSPAQLAGIQPGDRIVSIDGRQVDNSADVRFLIQLNLGANTPWVVERARQQLDISLVPRYQPPPPQGASGIRLADERVYVAQVTSGSLTESAGFQPGDGLLSWGRFPVQRQDHLPTILGLLVEAGEDTANVEVWRTDRLVTLAVPVSSDTLLTGFQLTTVPTQSRSYPIWEAVPRGITRVWNIMILAKNEVTTWFLGSRSPQLTGPIGIARLTGEVARAGFPSLLEFTALLSINLAIINILPIPALDGGRLLFVIIEWARRGKRISPEREGFVHMVGFVVLLALIAIISYLDILRILRGERIL